MNHENFADCYAGVVFNMPLDTVFTYEIPAPLRTGAVRIGSRVRAPFGNRTEVGFVVETLPTAPSSTSFKIRPITSLVDREPCISPSMFELAKWMSEFYCSSLGESLNAMSPPIVIRGEPVRHTVTLNLPKEKLAETIESLRIRAPKQADALEFIANNSPVQHSAVLSAARTTMESLKAMAKKGLIEIESSEFDPHAWRTGQDGAKIVELTRNQHVAVEEIIAAVRRRSYSTYLLHGITGSGKTEIYLRALSEVVNCGGRAIVLVPEISLTPQTIARFSSRFSRLAVLHSAMSAGLRNRQWNLAKNGKADVVIGARSAIFAPIENLRLIVVDEEHEPSYKQESTPRYHAREVAIMRASCENALVVLGSATPSLESYANAIDGKFGYIRLSERVGGGALPSVEIVNMIEERRELKKNVTLSRQLLKHIESSLSDGKQALLFLNRRGFHVYAKCGTCGAAYRCPNCDITLTYHKKTNILLCHYCAFKTAPVERCPQCNSVSMAYIGSGTERIEDVVAKHFPTARIARMDADTTTRRDSHSAILGAFRRGEIDILLGTQMVAKGLDYPNITTVGVIDADISLLLPDFRSSERTFQLLAQVAGRAGRGESAGAVIVQTTMPQAFAVCCATNHDYRTFAAKELEHRKALQYPPYSKLLRIIVRSGNKTAASDFIQTVKELLSKTAGELGVVMLGPSPPPVERLEGFYRFHLLLKSRLSKNLVAMAKLVRINAKPPSNVAMVLDNNPSSLM